MDGVAAARAEPEEAAVIARVEVEFPLVEGKSSVGASSSDDVVRMTLAVEEDGAVGMDLDELVAEGRAVVPGEVADVAKGPSHQLGRLDAQRRGLLQQADRVRVLRVRIPEFRGPPKAGHRRPLVPPRLQQFPATQLKQRLLVRRDRSAQHQRLDRCPHRVARHERRRRHRRLRHGRRALGRQPPLDLQPLVQPPIAADNRVRRQPKRDRAQEILDDQGLLRTLVRPLPLRRGRTRQTRRIRRRLARPDRFRRRHRVHASHHPNREPASSMWPHLPTRHSPNRGRRPRA
mmetsp:Transcript_11417/g.36223  ORF Transcript_11417/g.36223 Transcript_11417/m.36223 type:complete len:289 (-) Transcript_11417:139-1005(-)